jgi:hypothetical protein
MSAKLHLNIFLAENLFTAKNYPTHAVKSLFSFSFWGPEIQTGINDESLSMSRQFSKSN